jgi:hypothetical protein
VKHERDPRLGWVLPRGGVGPQIVGTVTGPVVGGCHRADVRRQQRDHQVIDDTDTDERAV